MHLDALAKSTDDAHHSRVSFRPSCLDASLPLLNDSLKRFVRHPAQGFCPRSVKFDRDVTEPAFLPRADRLDPEALVLANAARALEHLE